MKSSVTYIWMQSKKIKNLPEFFCFSQNFFSRHSVNSLFSFLLTKHFLKKIVTNITDVPILLPFASSTQPHLIPGYHTIVCVHGLCIQALRLISFHPATPLSLPVGGQVDKLTLPNRYWWVMLRNQGFPCSKQKNPILSIISPLSHVKCQIKIIKLTILKVIKFDDGAFETEVQKSFTLGRNMSGLPSWYDIIREYMRVLSPNKKGKK